MRWKWGLVAVFLGAAACASLDGLTGGDTTTELPEAGAADAIAPLPEAAAPIDASDLDVHIEAGPATFCNQVDAGNVMFCADFDQGAIGWTSFVDSAGQVSLSPQSTSHPNGVALAYKSDGGAGSVGLVEALQPLAGSFTTLSVAFDVNFDPLSNETEFLNLATLKSRVFLRYTPPRRIDIFAQTSGGASLVASNDLVGLGPRNWTHLVFNVSSTSAGITTTMQGTVGGGIVIDNDLSPSADGLHLEISATNETGPAVAFTTYFDNVVVSAY